jgi:hypothetical protein
METKSYLQIKTVFSMMQAPKARIQHRRLERPRTQKSFGELAIKVKITNAFSRTLSSCQMWLLKMVRAVKLIMRVQLAVSIRITPQSELQIQ